MMRTAGLLRGDFVNVGRDPMMALVLAAPLALGLLARFGIPLLDRLPGELPNLGAYAAFVQGIGFLLAPMLFGYVLGLLLLEERDEQILPVIAVSPLSISGFLRYRLALCAVGGVTAALVMVPLAGLVEVDVVRLLPVAMLAGLQGPFILLLLTAFADDRVRGLALAKLGGLSVLPPLAILLAPAPWHWLAGVFPQFWVVQAFLSSADGGFGYWLAVLIGAAEYGVMLGLLLWRALRRDPA